VKPSLIITLVLVVLSPVWISACGSDDQPPTSSATTSTASKTAPAPGATGGLPASASTAATKAAPTPTEAPRVVEALPPDVPLPEPKLVRSQWQSLYIGRKKIGYAAQNLYEFPDGGRRITTNEFLKLDLGTDHFGYVKTVTADVDARLRPRRLECSITSGPRKWEVKGRLDGSELVMVRTVGEKSASVRVPINDEVTFLSWALDATMLGKPAPGTGRRWLVIDESLGALLPDPCVIQIIGPRTMRLKADESLPGTAVFWQCGPEQAAYMIGADGKILGTVWQSTPMVAEGTSLSEARMLRESLDAPNTPELEGFSASSYRDTAHGFSMWVPPYPFVAHASAESGAAEIRSLVDESRMTVRLAALPLPAADVAAADAEAVRVADLVQRDWATRYEDVKAAPPAAAKINGRDGLACDGTARLGCTTFSFRNYFLTNEGRTYAVSIQVPDRPVTAEPTLCSSVIQSLQFKTPEGSLPIQIVGDVVRSPFQGLELRRPSARWSVPQHADGPAAALELARDDQAALVLIRVMTPRPGQPLEKFAAEQAKLAAENLDVPAPTPQPTTLDGRKAVEITYEGKKILSGRPARCTIVYTALENRMLAVALIVDGQADASAAKELQQIRESLKISAPAAAPTQTN
jgi:hypothetical protein